MKFILKYQLGGRLLLIIFGGCILLVGGTIALGIWLNLNEGIVSVLIIGGLAAIMFIAIKTTYKVTIVKIEGDKLFINKKEVLFSEIQYYFIRKETPKIEVLDLGLKSGNELTVTGINHGKMGDEIGKFISFMQERFNEPGSHVNLMESKASMKFMKMKRRGKRVIKGIIYFYLLFDVFILILFLSGWRNFPFWSVLTGNLILPMLIVYAFGDD
jgi:hypothetical protein